MRQRTSNCPVLDSTAGNRPETMFNGALTPRAAEESVVNLIHRGVYECATAMG